ncbi:helix-turn-helix domain-containing protein [Cognatishimia sp. SS12]|uniref:helix-turn-helix domain-containing protein n=1 Tax=Cognatishimia sp. SS12 TaxID=2979465 RepID=UPI0023310D41|nr:helix-turn-helix domain-containing protein [Cognatishimia sp. SS12]MDC0737210.1 helix-turn-helix domain-containing protein [Cognatishimia sp. SS12]
MITRKWRKPEAAEEAPKGFDDYEFRLGDEMRGERATIGKSLLDVQRELRIKASYIAAIENADPSAFETPGFIAGYVRSYARYLNMDPDETFAKFCRESGFQTAHGMSSEASSKRKPDTPIAAKAESNPFAKANAGFVPVQESILSRIEPRAIGSSLVLLALIGGIGYGGWSVLNEVQRVRLAPVEQTPVVLSALDPLTEAAIDEVESAVQASGVFTPPENKLDRLYRPQALDVPVLVSRDAPISTLNPQSIGTFMPERSAPILAAEAIEPAAPVVPQVLEEADPEVVMFAVRPAWVRVRAADGSILFEKTLDTGEEFIVPNTENAPTLQAGMSGSVYFRLNGEIRGPAGQGTGVVKNLAIDVTAVEENFAVADISGDAALAEVVAVAQAASVVVEED